MSAECIRAAGHTGPCNGLPRLDAGRYCYQLRSGAEGHQEHAAYGGKVHVPYSGPIDVMDPWGIRAARRDAERAHVIELEFTIAKLQQQLLNAQSEVERLERALSNALGSDPKTWPDWARSVDPQGAGK